MGTPVDPTPVDVREALAGAADAPGYPLTSGSAEFIAAARGWMARRRGVPAETAGGIVASVGSKEVVALLPTLLGLGPADTVVIPSLAYPTYDVGARLAGCRVVVSDDPASVDGAALAWVNSPANPSGRVLDAAALRAWASAARSSGTLLASDECYAEFGWTAEPVSALHPDVCGGDPAGIVVLHSLSKRSNMAGYRVGVIAGDEAMVARILEVRRHLGLMVPAPVQAAAVVAFADDDHVERQRARYLDRREVLLPALRDAGLRIDHSEAGLYLWATAGEPCWDTAARFAGWGILVTPGDFYGPAGDRHVRIALTATDADVAAAAARIGEGCPESARPA